MSLFLRGKWLGLFALCFLLNPGFVHAQATSGDLTGTVLDASGAAIPKLSSLRLTMQPASRAQPKPTPRASIASRTYWSANTRSRLRRRVFRPTH